jgi:beta-alanine degradation protein BauB
MMGRSTLALGVCGLAFMATSALVGAQREEYPRPPNHKLLFENPFVRVFDIRMAPGTSEAVHRHERGLTIALSDYENETTAVPGGQVSKGRTQFGEVRWAEPVVHSAKNVGTTEQRVIRIELK